MVERQERRRKVPPYQGELSLASPSLLHPIKDDSKPHRVDSRYLRGLIKLGMFIDNPKEKSGLREFIENIETERTAGRTDESDRLWRAYLRRYNSRSLQIIDDILSSAQAISEFESGYGLKADEADSKVSLNSLHLRIAHVFAEVDQGLVSYRALNQLLGKISRERLESFLIYFLTLREESKLSPVGQMLFLALIEGEAAREVLEPINKALFQRSDEGTQLTDISNDENGQKIFFGKIILSDDKRLGTEFLRGYHRLLEAHLWKLAIKNFDEDYEQAVHIIRAVVYRKSTLNNRSRSNYSKEIIKKMIGKDVEGARKIVMEDILKNGEKAYDKKYWYLMGVTEEMRKSFVASQHKEEVADRILNFEKNIDIQVIWRALGINPLERVARDNIFVALDGEIRLVDIKDGYVTFEKDEGIIDSVSKKHLSQTVRRRYTYGHLLDIMESQNFWKKEGESESDLSLRKTVIISRPRIDEQMIMK